MWISYQENTGLLALNLQLANSSTRLVSTRLNAGYMYPSLVHYLLQSKFLYLLYMYNYMYIVKGKFITY